VQGSSASGRTVDEAADGAACVGRAGRQEPGVKGSGRLEPKPSIFGKGRQRRRNWASKGWFGRSRNWASTGRDGRNLSRASSGQSGRSQASAGQGGWSRSRGGGTTTAAGRCTARPAAVVVVVDDRLPVDAVGDRRFLEGPLGVLVRVPMSYGSVSSGSVAKSIADWPESENERDDCDDDDNESILLPLRAVLAEKKARPSFEE